jgi:hypothetical protein
MPNCAECGLTFSNNNLSRSQIDRKIICDECVSRQACVVCHEEGLYRINDVCYCDAHFVPKPALIDPENGMWICECGKEALELNGFCDTIRGLDTYSCFENARLKRKCIHCEALQIPNGFVCSVCHSHQHIIQQGGKDVKRYVKRGGFSFDKHF